MRFFLFLSLSVFSLLASAKGSSALVSTLSLKQTFIDATDSIQQDTIIKSKKRERKPSRAALYAIIPGGGQIYNKKYWKLPLLYGLGYLIYYDYTINQTGSNFYRGLLGLKNDDAPREDYQSYVSEYENNAKIDVLDHTFYFNSSRTQIETNHLEYVSALQSDIVFFVLLYGVSFVDAIVDAHFSTYDVSDDLSLNWQPALIQHQNSSYAGLKFTLKLK